MLKACALLVLSVAMVSGTNQPAPLPPPGHYGKPDYYNQGPYDAKLGFGAPYGGAYGAPPPPYGGGSQFTFSKTEFQTGGAPFSPYGPGVLTDYHWTSTDYDDRFRCASLKFVDTYSQGVVQVYNMVPPLSQITILFWARMVFPHDYDYEAVVDGYADCPYFFSYSVETGYDTYAYDASYVNVELAMFCTHNIHVKIGNNPPIPTGARVLDDIWHQYVLVVDTGFIFTLDHKPLGYGYADHYNDFVSGAGLYGKPFGSWCFYCDGVHAAGTCMGYGGYGGYGGHGGQFALEFDGPLRGGGNFVFGGRISSYSNLQYTANRAADPHSLFIGSLSNIQILSVALDDFSVVESFRDCKNICGDVFNWWDYWTYAPTIGTNIKWDGAFGPSCCKKWSECYQLKQLATGPTGFPVGLGFGHFGGPYGGPLGPAGVFGYDSEGEEDGEKKSGRTPPPKTPKPGRTPPKSPNNP